MKIFAISLVNNPHQDIKLILTQNLIPNYLTLTLIIKVN